MSFASRFRQSTLRLAAWSAAMLLGACGGRSERLGAAEPGPRLAGAMTAVAASVYTVRKITPGLATLTARGMNASGQIAGFNYTSGRAFLFDGKQVRDLGSLGTGSSATALNARGAVTGYYVVGEGRDATVRAFVHDGQSMRDLGTFGGDASYGVDINAAGQITGYARLPDNETTHAFLYDGRVLRDLGTLGGASSNAMALNAAGQVIGTAQVAGGGTHAFLYDGARMRDLGTLGGRDSYAQDINKAGVVVGYALVAGNGRFHAFVHDGVRMRDLGTLGGTNSMAGAVNNRGQIIGQSDIAGDAASHAFLYDGCTMSDLGTLGGMQTVAYAINASGQVVGWSETADGALHAFLWSAANNGIVDLNTRLRGAPPDLVLNQAVAIADNGSIAAYSNIGLVLLEPADDADGAVATSTNATMPGGTFLPAGAGLAGPAEAAASRAYQNPVRACATQLSIMALRPRQRGIRSSDRLMSITVPIMAA